MEVHNDTDNQEVIYEVQDGGGPAGPFAREVLLDLDQGGSDVKNDIKFIRNARGVAGYVRNRRTASVPPVSDPIFLTFYERTGSPIQYVQLPDSANTAFPSPTNHSSYRLTEVSGKYFVEAF